MRKVKIETLITKSIQRTKLILFKPFSLKKWLFLLLIAWLAGALNGGCGNGGGGNWGPNYDSAKEAEAALTYAEEDTLLSASDNEDRDLTNDSDQANVPGMNAPVFAAALVGGIIIFVIALMLLLMWISARFRFVWFDALVKNDASIKEPFRRYKKEGNSLFWLHLILAISIFLFIGILAGIGIAGSAGIGLFDENPDVNIGALMGILTPLVLIFILGIIFFAILGVFIENFVVTIMAVDRSTFRPAWRKFIAILKGNAKDLCLYILIIMVLGIAAGIIMLFISIFVIIALLIIAALIFGISYVLLVTLLKANVIYGIFAFIVGVPYFLIFVITSLSIGLPFAVFFRCFSLYFLTSLNCGYSPLPLEETNPA